MIVWWITLFSTYILCAMARIYCNVQEQVDGSFIWKPNKILSFIAFMILLLVAGWRKGIGDTGTYRSLFNAIPMGFKDYVVSLLQSDGEDKGYSIIQAFIKNFIADDTQVYIFIIAFITLGFIFITFYKYSGVLELAVFFFIAGGGYLVVMNGMRQYLVASIMFFIFPLIEQRKWKKYFIITFILSTIHGSALVFIPLYFIVNLPAWGKGSKWILGLGILAYIFYPAFGGLLSILLESTQYSHYGDSILAGGSAGSNLIRTLVAFVPIVLAYIGKEDIEKYEKHFNSVLNFSIFNAIAMLLSSAASWIFARFSIYFFVYSVILLCWGIKYVFKGKNRGIAYVLALICYTIFYYYEMVISLNMTYSFYF